MKRVLVLGAGMVGRAIAADLSKQFDVCVADNKRQSLRWLTDRYTVRSVLCDFRSDAGLLRTCIEDAHLVVSAVPGSLGYRILKTIIKAGKNAVDISFFGEDPFELDELAKKKGVTAVVDCGVAPGMSNMLAGYYSAHMSDVDEFECLVGGLPLEPSGPFKYKAPFSPSDVIQEYLRPARLMIDGKIVTVAALSDVEMFDFGMAGTLEAFNTDGLRTLVRTMNIPNMREKTLRYPGHAAAISLLRDAGLLNTEPVEINGRRIRPLDMTSRMLMDQWKLSETDREFTVMRVKIAGTEKSGVRQKYFYNLYDRTDTATGLSSMARTTGYTATAVADLVLSGVFTRMGICPPEYIGTQAGCLEFVLRYQEERGVFYEVRTAL